MTFTCAERYTAPNTTTQSQYIPVCTPDRSCADRAPRGAGHQLPAASACATDRSGCGTARIRSSSMPAKSAGLHVWSGRSLAIAVAAMSASYARAAGLRPARRKEAATRPNARAASASNGSVSSRLPPAEGAPAVPRAPGMFSPRADRRKARRASRRSPPNRPADAQDSRYGRAG
jgi:hypothetical protein